ncbi:hypothetical protein GQX73_g7272 [Xylaria multiplex]|uniref:Uncharacterized protein n=1 Tax=Xylaria multiplex TaxID=323545 RepID=A0A7C8IL16_9PEZI|nr:hypothetical protein GQX73_g7272 [Xylaria multiplex]
MSSPVPNPATPSSAAPPKLAMSEMHPSKVHQTMAPPSSGLRHGFTDIDYNKTPMHNLIQTPSKTPAPSSDFTFRYVRHGSEQGLGPEARRLMESLRDEAAKIKVQLTAERDRERAQEEESAEGRKIAAAKGKSSRFSAAHLAEFKKMDSIEGHASSFRAAPGRFTPVKANTPAIPITPLKPGIKRSQSKANLDEPDSARPKTLPRPLARSPDKNREAPDHPSKRIRQRIEDDASTLRPVSRDGTSIPRPKSSGNDSLRTGIPRSHTLGSFPTPSRSALVRNASISRMRTPTISLVQSPSQPDLQRSNSFSAKVGKSILKSPSKKGFGGLKMWGTTNNLGAESTKVPTQVETPGRFGRIKSILKRQASGTKTKDKSAIPQPSSFAPKTPGRFDLTDKMFPTVPLTTPGCKRDRHVDFTPNTKPAAIAQESPSPVKPSIPLSKKLSALPAPKFVAGGKAGPKTGEVTYPDLSAYGVDGDKPEPAHEPAPGTFTFRSDHTICFDNSPSRGFGSAAGQASLRHVRKSAASSTRMPGSFPQTSGASPNKENKDPVRRNSIPHGMTNKKRHRASSDEDEDVDDEGAKRGTKKLRKNPSAAEGPALVAPRLLSKASPTKRAMSSTPQSPSPKKKTGGLSLSRLQMLSQPKIRMIEVEVFITERRFPVVPITLAGLRGMKKLPVMIELRMPPAGCPFAVASSPSTHPTSYLHTAFCTQTDIYIFISPEQPLPTSPSYLCVIDPGYETMPHRHTLFTCTFCWNLSRGPPHVLGREARLTCDRCLRGLTDLAVCWVCGEVVCRGDECAVVTAPEVRELFEEEGWDGDGVETEMETGRHIFEVPMCVNCAVACENDDRDALTKRALRRIDVADAGLSRLRWKIQGRNEDANRAPGSITARQSLLGGDSSMDLVSPSPDISPAPSPAGSSCSVDERRGKGNGEEGDGTIARLHYRRSTDPRFAELECLVPQHAALYVSIFDPINAPAFKPSPAKPLPSWMQLLPRNQRDTGKDGCGRTWSPRSVLDIHFPPAEAFARPCSDGGSARADECGVKPADELENEKNGSRNDSGNENGMEIVRPHARLPPSSSPPQGRNDSQFPDQVECDCGSDSDLQKGDRGRPDSPPDLAPPADEFDSEYEIEHGYGIPPLTPYKRPAVVADEPLRRPSARRTASGSQERLDPKVMDGRHAVSAAVTGINANSNRSSVSTRKQGDQVRGIYKSNMNGKGKGKSVAWDKTVEGGESDASDASCEQLLREMESGGGVEKAEDCPPKRCPPPRAGAGWLRAQTPPAQSMEFLDIYQPGRDGGGEDAARGKGLGREIRLLNPSLALPGRRRAEVGGAKACPTCGNVSNY